MRRSRKLLGGEQGIALILVVLVLFCLTGLVFAYLSVSAIEPQISRNLADASRARYLAEAGIERGFNVLVMTADASNSWSALLAGATTSSPWIPVAGLTNASIGGGGTFSVTIRNDNGASDMTLTGMTAATNPPMDTTPTIDANRVVIMRSRGTVNRATKTIEVVVRRVALPPLPGAFNMPGRQAETFIETTNFDIDGRDYGCIGGASCDPPGSWSVNAAIPLKFGMTTQPGAQATTGATLESAVASALDTAAKRDVVKGKDRTNPSGPYTTGLNTVAADASLDPAGMDAFVALVAGNAATTVLRSTPACPMVFTGSASGLTNTPTLTNGCGVNTTVNLGSRQDPKVVFFRGDATTPSKATGLSLGDGIKGAGLLVIQDGNLQNYGILEWDGLVIVAGSSTAMAFMNGSTTTVRGAAIAYESNPDGPAGSFDLYAGTTSRVSVRASSQNVEMVQRMRSLHSLTNWREL